MSDLFAPDGAPEAVPDAAADAPLADRLRPRALAEIIGQEHLTGPEGAIGRMVAAGRLSLGLTRPVMAHEALGLRTWDKPAAACLASRVPYGTTVSVSVLSRVERAEAALRRGRVPTFVTQAGTASSALKVASCSSRTIAWA